MARSKAAAEAVAFSEWVLREGVEAGLIGSDIDYVTLLQSKIAEAAPPAHDLASATEAFLAATDALAAAERRAYGSTAAKYRAVSQAAAMRNAARQVLDSFLKKSAAVAEG